MFELVHHNPQLGFKFQLDWRYCFGDNAIARFWHFGWKMPIRANFWRFWGMLNPLNCDIIVLNPKWMQYFQKHAF